MKLVLLVFLMIINLQFQTFDHNEYVGLNIDLFPISGINSKYYLCLVDWRVRLFDMRKHYDHISLLAVRFIHLISVK
jgi:hypothetical protein